MSLEPRFVWVARQSNGLDPDEPRHVVNVARVRAGPSEDTEVLPTSEDTEVLPIGPPPYVPIATEFRLRVTESGLLATAGLADARSSRSHPNAERPTAVLPIPPETDRPPRYSRTAEHRRRLRRAVLRRFEIGVWACAVVIAAALVVFVVGEPRQARWQASQRPSAPAEEVPPSSATTGQCVFEPCNRPAYAGEPTLVRIPSIQVESSLESLSLDAARHLEPPTSYERAGWWREGVVPGDVGAAVIAGHVDSAKGPAVFFRLHELRPGDIIEVVRDEVVTFTVTAIEQYPKNKFPTGRVYQPTPDAELRLITCGGDFDENRQSYRDNIVVYAVLA